jgi:hypothetical protein
MKKLFGLAFLIALTITACKENVVKKIDKEKLEIAKQKNYTLTEGAAAITFSKTEHDFGVINEGDVVETTFDFTNTGKADLIITNAVGSCGCTVPEWPKEPIPVGGKGTIKVKFNSHGKPNNQRKSVSLTTNTATGKEQVFIKANVTPKQKTK